MGKIRVSPKVVDVLVDNRQLNLQKTAASELYNVNRTERGLVIVWKTKLSEKTLNLNVILKKMKNPLIAWDN